MKKRIVVNGQSVDLNVDQEEVNTAVDVKIGDLNAILDAINNGSSPSNLRDVTVALEPSEAGTVRGAGYATDGVVMSLSADLAEGYKVDHWEKNGQVITASEQYDLTVDGNAAVTAVATQKQYVLGRDWRLVPLGDGTKKYNCRRVAYGNGVYIMAVYNSNVCLRSRDGATWEERLLPITGSWYNIVFVNGKFILDNRATGEKWLTTQNGEYWSQIAPPNDTVAIASNVAYVENGNAYFVSSSSSVPFVYATTDGQTWRTVNYPQNGRAYYATAKLNGRRIMVHTNSSSTEYLYSDDGGETWNTSNFPKLGNNLNIVVFQNKFVVVEAKGAYVLTSEDGLSWEDVSLPSGVLASAVVSSNGTLTTFGGNYIKMYETSDLKTWTEYQVPNYSASSIYPIQTGEAFDTAAIVPASQTNCILVSYSTDDPLPTIPDVATTVNALGVENEEEVIE